MKKHHRYSLQTRIAFALGIERDLLLPSELEKIPYSTRAWLRRQNVDDLIERDPQASHQILSEIRSGMLHLNTQLTDTYAVTYRLIRSLRRTLGERGYQKLLFEMRNDLVPAVDTLKTYSSKDTILRIFGVTRYRYAEWESSYRFTCSSSPMSLCARKHTAQLLPKEISALRKVLKDPKTAHWSIASVWAKGFRDGKLSFSRSTAYENNRKYQIRKRNSHRKKRHNEGIRAIKINQIWHADTSKIRTLDGFEIWVYAIIDNYSRKILALRIAIDRCGSVMRDVLRDAILTYNPECCIWVTDGGTENKNAEVTSMLRRYNKKIKHAVAMSDILQSNSMIERVFYTLKYTQRLRGIEIRSIGDAVEFMDWFVDDYNSRPHSVHGLFSPNEMYDGINTFDYSGVLKKGMAKRKIVNAQCSCTKCICGVSDSK